MEPCHIIYARKRHALTQSDIAKLTHCCNQTVSQWERGLRTPDAFQIAILKILTVRRQENKIKLHLKQGNLYQAIIEMCRLKK